MLFQILFYYRGEWPRGLRCCAWNQEVPGSNPLGAQLDFGTQTHYKAPGDLEVEISKH